MDSKRKPNWREEEVLLLAELVEQRKQAIKGKFSPTLTSADKKKAWEDISGFISIALLHFSCGKETKRHHKIQLR